MIKFLGEIKDTRNIRKYNKSNIQQDDNQHQIKWREKAFPLESGIRQG